MRAYGKNNHRKNYKTIAELPPEIVDTKRKKERIYRENNREHFREYKRNYEAERRKSDPTYRAYCKILSCVRRFSIKGKNGRSLQYIGVSSAEEFISILSEKSNNPNWMQDGYHIDHIWQINWFDITDDNWSELCWIVNRHQNLRAVPSYENLTRGHYDFSPLCREDFEFYGPYLKKSIYDQIALYFQTCK
jgi:hypothetical protein